MTSSSARRIQLFVHSSPKKCILISSSSPGDPWSLTPTSGHVKFVKMVLGVKMTWGWGWWHRNFRKLRWISCARQSERRFFYPVYVHEYAPNGLLIYSLSFIVLCMADSHLSILWQMMLYQIVSTVDPSQFVPMYEISQQIQWSSRMEWLRMISMLLFVLQDIKWASRLLTQALSR